MAKLSRDATSWRAYGLVRRNEDWENDPKLDARKPKNNKKDTNRWCKGKEGVEHDIRAVPYGGPINCNTCKVAGKICKHRYTRNKCINCGKDRTWRMNSARKSAEDKARQRQLASEWCDSEGHEWMWSKFNNTMYDGMTPRFVMVKGEIMEHTGSPHWPLRRPWRMPKVHQVCEMCGLERRGKTRNITPEDL